MATKSYEREFGEVQKTLEHLTKNQENIIKASKEHRDEVDKKLEGIGDDVSSIKSKFDQLDGAWKATTIIAAVAGVAGSLLWSAAKLILAIPLR
jgi:multidrug resistance efflux pump